MAKVGDMRPMNYVLVLTTLVACSDSVSPNAAAPNAAPPTVLGQMVLLAPAEQASDALAQFDNSGVVTCTQADVQLPEVPASNRVMNALDLATMTAADLTVGQLTATSAIERDDFTRYMADDRLPALGEIGRDLRKGLANKDHAATAKLAADAVAKARRDATAGGKLTHAATCPDVPVVATCVLEGTFFQATTYYYREPTSASMKACMSSDGHWTGRSRGK